MFIQARKLVLYRPLHWIHQCGAFLTKGHAAGSGHMEASRYFPLVVGLPKSVDIIVMWKGFIDSAHQLWHHCQYWSTGGPSLARLSEKQEYSAPCLTTRSAGLGHRNVYDKEGNQSKLYSNCQLTPSFNILFRSQTGLNALQQRN